MLDERNASRRCNGVRTKLCAGINLPKPSSLAIASLAAISPGHKASFMGNVLVSGCGKKA